MVGFCRKASPGDIFFSGANPGNPPIEEVVATTELALDGMIKVLATEIGVGLMRGLMGIIGGASPGMVPLDDDGDKTIGIVKEFCRPGETGLGVVASFCDEMFNCCPGDARTEEIGGLGFPGVPRGNGAVYNGCCIDAMGMTGTDAYTAGATLISDCDKNSKGMLTSTVTLLPAIAGITTFNGVALSKLGKPCRVRT